MEDLTLGFKGKHCSFEFREFEDRTEAAQAAYLKLKSDLLRHGMRDPLITYLGHVLVGQRRFEILRDTQKEFPSYEVLEDVSEWVRDDIKRLSRFKDMAYGANEFIG